MSLLRLLVAGRRDGGVIDMDNFPWEAFGFATPTDFFAAVERGIERGHLERDGDHLLRLTVRGDATAALSPVTPDNLPPVGVRIPPPPPPIAPDLPDPLLSATIKDDGQVAIEPPEPSKAKPRKRRK